MAAKDKKKAGSKKKGVDYFQVADADFPKATRPARLQKKYTSEIAPALKEKLGFKNSMNVPRLTTIIVNSSTSDAVGTPKVLDSVAGEMAVITGQKPVLTRAKKSIAGFKVREGMPLGARVTLRGKRMYEFMDRLVNVALPRVRDFSGVNPKAFDGRGNYTLGLKDQMIFPEIDFDKIEKSRGMSITFVTTAKDNESARVLLSELGMPFKK